MMHKEMVTPEVFHTHLLEIDDPALSHEQIEIELRRYTNLRQRIKELDEAEIITPEIWNLEFTI